MRQAASAVVVMDSGLALRTPRNDEAVVARFPSPLL